MRIVPIGCARARRRWRSAASSLAVAQDKVSLRLNWYLGGLHVPFYYGKDKGYLRRRRHRPHDQRRPRLGQHRAGGRRRLRHVRPRRLVVGRS